MKPRTTIFLVALAVVLGAIAFWDYKKGVSTEEAERRARKLIEMKAAEVTRLQLVRSNETILLEKRQDHWEIQQPLAVRADDNAVNAILDQLEFAQRQRTFAEKELDARTLADFGLTHPRLQLTFRDSKGEHTILFGTETATKDAVYAQVQGQKTACLVPQYVFERADANLNSLRNRVLLDFLPEAATRVEIKVADRLLELAKAAARTNTEPRWSIVKPFPARADQQKVADLLGEISGLRVQDFVSETAKDAHQYRLDEPRIALTVWIGERSQTLLLGGSPTNDASRVYAKLKNADPIYTVSAESAKKFDLQVNDLRDTHVLSFRESDVHRIELSRKNETVLLTRTGVLWNVSGPLPVPAEDAVVHDLLRRLNELTTTQFVADVATDLAPYGLGAPSLSITLWGEGTNVVTGLLVGAPDPQSDSRFLKRTDEPFIYGVSSNAIAWIPTSRLAYRARRVAELKVDDMTKLTVEKATGKIVVERAADRKWKLVAPAQGVLHPDRLRPVLDLLAFLRAEEIVRENLENLPQYGLDKPTHRFVVETGVKAYLLQIGAAKDATATFASWSDPALVFTLGPATMNTLTNEFVSGITTTNPPPARTLSP